VKAFGNQVTLSTCLNGKALSVKLFKNGSVQMTGLRRIDDGITALRLVLGWLWEHYKCSEQRGVAGLMDAETAAPTCRVCMINSDFDLGLRIKRNMLRQTMQEHFTDIQCCYDPCIYPGVKIKYMHNSDAPPDRQGRCICPGGACGGKGDGSSSSAGCRKVTIVVFQSGKTIITGAVSIVQLNDAYGFVTRALTPYADEFVLKP
jgi:TATA-box binding protein (TBP) (component of TFIID and TFIIIB)